MDVEPAERLKRGSLVAGVHVELTLEFLPVIDDHREFVADAGDTDIEEALVREVALVRRHDGDRLVGGDPLRHVHVEAVGAVEPREHRIARSEEHTSELQSLMRISYAVSCLKKK